MIVYEANVTMVLQGVRMELQPNQDIYHVDHPQNENGFAKIFCFGKHKNHFFMTMDLMGPSLADLYQFCGYRFSLKTTMMLAHQLIERFEHMHKKKFIHRDVKPDNFLMGLHNKSS